MYVVRGDEITGPRDKSGENILNINNNNDNHNYNKNNNNNSNNICRDVVNEIKNPFKSVT